MLLIGAGKTGEKLAREIRTTLRNQYDIVGFIDDNVEKHGAILHGRKVFCGISDLPNLNIKYDELLITAPSASGDQIRRIVVKFVKLLVKDIKPFLQLMRSLMVKFQWRL